MQGPFLRKYGIEATFNFTLFEIDGVDFRIDAAHAAGDTVVMKDEGAEASTDNAFVDEGQGYSITLTATEMQAARIVIYVVDQGTKVWLDTAIAIDTYGHASAQHAIDLDDAVRAGLTALPNAAADAAGGLPISDTGGLDLDAILADTGELQTDDVPGLISNLNNISPAEVNTEIDTALADIHLDHLLATDYDPASKPGTPTALLNELVENDGGVSRFTANALEEAPGAAGAGAIEFTYTLTSTGAGTPPIDGATVWCTTDEAGTNTVASGTTDSFGEVTFYLDAGTYYFWRQASGWTFDNPDTEAVS